MRRWEARNQDLDSCEVIAKSSDDTLLHYVADVWTDMEDARLIAAAPELLELLKRYTWLVKTRMNPNSQLVQDSETLIAQLEENNTNAS